MKMKDPTALSDFLSELHKGLNVTPELIQEAERTGVDIPKEIAPKDLSNYLAEKVGGVLGRQHFIAQIIFDAVRRFDVDMSQLPEDQRLNHIFDLTADMGRLVLILGDLIQLGIIYEEKHKKPGE
jgi:hypothetical protein